MKRFLNTSLAGLILTTGLCVTVPGFAQDRRNPDDRYQDQRYQDQRDQRRQVQRYHDQRRNEDHEWNDHEQQAYRMWLRNRHRREVDFNRLSRRDQQNYWNWRHSHSDAQLKIDIR
ncbi:MAG TPA: hypothetical protein VHC72_17240 [Bryobacteraceae bacterium]|nr:hypothetical protein [Bryobacteraceae bacterium]